MKTIWNKFKIITALAILVGSMLNSCRDDFKEGDFSTNVSVNMNSFSVNGVQGTINNQLDLITVKLPYGTPVSSLKPQFSIPDGATVNPAAGSTVDFTNAVNYRVKNGNIYKDYTVSVSAQNPIISFTINGLAATINPVSKTISLALPQGTSLDALQPQIVTEPGVSISPVSGSTINFTNPVQFTVSNNLISEVYTATVTVPVTGLKVAFLGTAATIGGLTNPDEIAASSWLFSKFAGSTYISFADIANGASLANIDVLWWHNDSAQALPTAALNQTVINSIKNYINSGGNILLTTFASQYTETLGIVPSGKGPNNVFGDFLPNGFVSQDDWGISFKGNETHPIFQGLQTYTSGKANLLEKGTFRLNHTAWWFLPEWGGYGDGMGWRNQTGGKNLASEQWDDALNGRVTIAEFPGGTANKNCVVISMGAYDWYNETSNGTPSQTNAYLDNIKMLTSNSIVYLKNN